MHKEALENAAGRGRGSSKTTTRPDAAARALWLVSIEGRWPVALDQLGIEVKVYSRGISRRCSGTIL